MLFFELHKWPKLLYIENTEYKYSRVQILWFSVGLLLNESFASYTVSIKDTILNVIGMSHEQYTSISNQRLEQYKKELDRLADR